MNTEILSTSSASFLTIRRAVFYSVGIYLAVANSCLAEDIGPVLPVVPLQESRPAESSDKAGQWKTDRDGQETEPVASFIETLKGNDAAIQIVLGQGRILTTRQPIATEAGDAMIAVGDPSIVDFDILPNPRMIRLLGKRAGVTDLSITTSDNQVYNFEVHVGYDLELIRVQLQQVFPDAQIRLGQIREHIVVEGQARSPAQVTQILHLLQSYLSSTSVTYTVTDGAPTTDADLQDQDKDRRDRKIDHQDDEEHMVTRVEVSRPHAEARPAAPNIINLLRVPGPQQVMLQVRIAELNRTAFREVGADILSTSGDIIGTSIAGTVSNFIDGTFTSPATVFGLGASGDWNIFLKILRENSVLNILAEPNLVAMNGRRASFLAGGEFPVPVPQNTGGGGGGGVTIQFKDFGVQLDFTPYIQDDGVIRLQVESEVSTVDFSIGTTLVAGGDPVPGLITRRTNTTVGIKQGQSLAIAGLLNIELDAKTSRIPGLGDLPYLGPFFSNTTHKRVEKELIILVTPMFVSPMETADVGPLPGSEIMDPNDEEFYWLNRIEGRTGREHRATTNWDNPLGLVECLELQRRCTCGRVGFSK